MKHKDKLKLARRLSGKQSGAFQSKEWEARKMSIRKKIKKRELNSSKEGGKK